MNDLGGLQARIQSFGLGCQIRTKQLKIYTPAPQRHCCRSAQDVSGSEEVSTLMNAFLGFFCSGTQDSGPSLLTKVGQNTLPPMTGSLSPLRLSLVSWKHQTDKKCLLSARGISKVAQFVSSSAFSRMANSPQKRTRSAHIRQFSFCRLVILWCQKQIKPTVVGFFSVALFVFWSQGVGKTYFRPRPPSKKNRLKSSFQKQKNHTKSSLLIDYDLLCHSVATFSPFAIRSWFVNNSYFEEPTSMNFSSFVSVSHQEKRLRKCECGKEVTNRASWLFDANASGDQARCLWTFIVVIFFMFLFLLPL